MGMGIPIEMGLAFRLLIGMGIMSWEGKWHIFSKSIVLHSNMSDT